MARLWSNSQPSRAVAEGRAALQGCVPVIYRKDLLEQYAALLAALWGAFSENPRKSLLVYILHCRRE
jgi:hypothetical protein